MPSFLYFTSQYPIISFVANQAKQHMVVAINATIQKWLKRDLRHNTEISKLASYGKWLSHNSVPSEKVMQ